MLVSEAVVLGGLLGGLLLERGWDVSAPCKDLGCHSVQLATPVHAVRRPKRAGMDTRTEPASEVVHVKRIVTFLAQNVVPIKRTVPLPAQRSVAVDAKDRHSNRT